MVVVAGWFGGQPRWAPLFVGLGDGDVGPAAAPTGDHDLADGVGLLVPAPVVSFPPDPLGTAGQHPDTSFFGGGGGGEGCVCPADPALAHHHGLISRCGSQQPGKGRIEPRRSPAPWPTCSRATLQPPLWEGEGEQTLGASVSSPSTSPDFTSSPPISASSPPNWGQMLATATKPKAPGSGDATEPGKGI